MVRNLWMVILFFASAVFSQTSSWQTLNSVPIVTRYNDIYFVTPARGWIANGSGQIYRTLDGGVSWVKQFEKSTAHFRSIGFVDSLHGWAGNVGPGEFGATDTSTIYQTADGGKTWTPVQSFSGPKPRGLCGMHVVNDSVICAVGRVRGPAFFARTTNRGKTWTSKDMSQYAAGLIDVYFFHPDTGVAVGLTKAPNDSAHGVTLLTVDGGQTWERRYVTRRIGEWCWKVSFPSRQVGYAALQRDKTSSINFLKTTDGGKTWQEKLFSNSYYFVQGIGFINEKTGWIGGSSAASSGYQTTDGGETWQPAGFGSRLNRFRFLSDTLGYAAGQRAYKYTVRTTSVTERTAAVPESFSLSQNFPNPFWSEATSRLAGNPGTAIKFTLPKAAHVRITVFDLNGRQIDDILNQTREAGTHTVVWDAADKEGRLLRAGVYFYKLSTADFTATRKMILLR
ncbi:MAG: Ycf48-like protein [bacterium]|nr:Ycf48-like protein [bacterium]